METTPERIGKYELLQFLGGGMSHVYRATDTVLRRTVAVKILTEQGCTDREAKARFLQEAITAGNIQHENIIKVYDYGEEKGRPFIVMEFLTGEDLRDAICNGHTGELANRLRIALSVARAIQHVHEKHIIHRDIKPENIHIDQQGQVRLMDFGIAKSEGFSMTKTGFALGTPYYMSPEQVRGEPATERVDIYAFGVLLYELMAGAKPFSADTLERLFYMILNEPLDIEALRRQGVPEPLCDLIARCSAKKREDRPSDFAEVIRELERIASLDSSQAAAAAPAIPAPAGEAKAAPEPVRPEPLTSQVDAPAVSVTAPPVAPAPQPPPPAAPVPASASKLLLIFGLAGVLVLAGAVGIYLFLANGGGKNGGKGGNGSKQKQGQQKEALAPVALAPVLSTPTGEMILIPAGQFVFGDDSNHNRKLADLPAFYIDRTEVTNQAWASFAAAAGKPAPKGNPGLPVTNITIAQAREFAQWAGKRLPSAEEWEKAARGADGRKFPWGNDADAKRANVNTHRIGPANGFSQWPSPFGALNMAGNVWEFVDGPVTPSDKVVKTWRDSGRLKPAPTLDEPWCAMRGGSYDDPLDYAVAYEWLPVPERASWVDIGFRCARDAGK